MADRTAVVASPIPSALSRPAAGDVLVSRADRLYRRLSEEIARGVYPVGSQLPNEAALCVHYQVSRTVLREAVARLKADGVMDTHQGRGSFVLQHSLRTPFRFDPSLVHQPAGIGQLAELRLGVEGAASALAAERRSVDELERLRQCLDRMAGGGPDGIEADLAFHRIIAGATRNDFYQTFMAYLHQSYAIAIQAARVNSARTAGQPAKVQEEHVAIYEAIAAGDPARAEAEMKRHIRNAAARLLGPHKT